MGLISAFLIVMGLIIFAYIGSSISGLQPLFAVVFPYVALIIFIVGFVVRIIKWGKSPVPYRIPTTAGQQFSLPWIKQNKIDNPSTGWGVLLRMFLKFLCSEVSLEMQNLK